MYALQKKLLMMVKQDTVQVIGPRRKMLSEYETMEVGDIVPHQL